MTFRIFTSRGYVINHVNCIITSLFFTLWKLWQTMCVLENCLSFSVFPVLVVRLSFGVALCVLVEMLLVKRGTLKVEDSIF